MSEGAAPHSRWRTRCAVALLLLGLVVAFVPGLLAGDRFLLEPFETTFPYGTVGISHFGFGGISSEGPVTASAIVVRFWPPTSLGELVSTDVAWAIPAATLVLVPGLFLWWRRSAVNFGRVVGAASAVAASIVVCALVLTRDWNEFVPPGWIWVGVPLGGALMAAAFLVATAPRVRDE